jgi:hypothetical protein
LHPHHSHRRALIPLCPLTSSQHLPLSNRS